MLAPQSGCALRLTGLRKPLSVYASSSKVLCSSGKVSAETHHAVTLVQAVLASVPVAAPRELLQPCEQSDAASTAQVVHQACLHAAPATERSVLAQKFEHPPAHN